MNSLTGILANNVNDRFSMKTNNVNDNDIALSNAKSEAQVDGLATYLMEKLGAPANFRQWYCKVCWSLSESKVMDLLELATRKGRNPGKYFTYLANREMRKSRYFN